MLISQTQSINTWIPGACLWRQQHKEYYFSRWAD